MLKRFMKFVLRLALRISLIAGCAAAIAFLAERIDELKSKGKKLVHKRVIEYSKKWKCRSKYTEDLIKKNYVADVCIAAVKVRGLSKGSSLSKKNCLKMMAQDRMFKDEFSLKYLELFRIPVAVALKFRQYWMVNLISFFVGKAKGR